MEQRQKQNTSKTGASLYLCIEVRKNLTCFAKWLDIIAIQSTIIGVIKDEVKKISRDQIMQSVLYSSGLGLTERLILKITGVKMSQMSVCSYKVSSAVYHQCASSMFWSSHGLSIPTSRKKKGQQLTKFPPKGHFLEVIPITYLPLSQPILYVIPVRYTAAQKMQALGRGGRCAQLTFRCSFTEKGRGIC